MSLLTFIIPIRHQDSSNNWDLLVHNLKRTTRSIQGQTNNNWNCTIVANTGARLPQLPDRFNIHYVDFPPNKNYKQGEASREIFRDAVRLDKGKRLAAGIEHSKHSKYFMFVDDDDFVHCDIVSFVDQNEGKNGWYVKNGLVWKSGGKFVFKYQDFYLYCGTSHIIRSDLLDPKSMDESKIKKLLGSHVHLKASLDQSKSPLEPLPFLGAVYQIGHLDAHSKSKGLFHAAFFNKKTLTNPCRLFRNLWSFRWFSKSLQSVYFGD